MNKLSHENFLSQLDELLTPELRASGGAEKLLEILQSKTLDDLPSLVQQEPSIIELRNILDQLSHRGITNARFDVSVMRGFDYYTDIVFEVFDTHPDNNRSMMGGGRYDGLVALFGVAAVPTVGFGLGDATLANFLEIHGLLPQLFAPTDLYAVLIGNVAAGAQHPLTELREMGLNIAVDYSGRKIGDQLKSATKKGITYAIMIGESELGEELYSLKNLVTGSEEKHGLQRIVSIVKDRRMQK
jgi:histidyl-tRNA synthetase